MKPNRPFLTVQQLAVEVTRDCNMRCEHCLRGDAEDIYMKTSYMRALLQQVDRVDEVVFTGGEPCLNLKAIKKFMELVHEYGVEFGSFCIITNGTVEQERLALLALEMYQEADYKEGCLVSISEDMFHDGTRQSSLLKGLKCYHDAKKHDPEMESPHEWVIKSGRAERNGIGHPPAWQPADFRAEAVHDEDGELRSIDVDLVYLSCNGRVYYDCDMSYDDMDENEGVPVKRLRDCMIEKISGN